jgi:hypothetical protein
MEFLFVGILGLVVGFYWIRSAKREQDIRLIRYYNGIASIIAGTLLTYLGITKVFEK